jgi:hypothetical protein
MLVSTCIVLGCAPADEPQPAVSGTVPLPTPDREHVLSFLARSGAVGPEGRIAVTDIPGGRVLVLGDDGSETVVGRPGDGPCEFRNPVSVAWADSGVLAVVDAHAGRVHFCGLDGVDERTQLIPGEPLALQRGGTGILVLTQVGRDTLLVLHVSVPARGAINEAHDTLLLVSRTALAAKVGAAPNRVAVTLGARGRLLIGAADSAYRFIVADPPSGSAGPVIDLPEKLTEMTEAEIAEEQAEFLAAFKRMGVPVPPAAPERPRPQFKLRFTDRPLAQDSTGMIWAIPAMRHSQGFVLDAIGRDGTLYRRYALPQRPVSIRSDGDRLILVSKTDDGGSVVTVFSAGRLR